MFKNASVPTNLFIDTPEVHDGSTHQLSNDIDSWPEDIIQKIKERVPKVSGMNAMVKFMKKDEENGTATGSIVITSPDKTAIVPIIVKDFNLMPLDVIIAKQRLLPLTPDYFDAIFEDNNIFQKLEEYPMFSGLGRFEDANLWNSIYPPSLGRYAYASAGYPIMDAISDDIDGGPFRKELREMIDKDEKIAARFVNNGHWDLMKKVANLTIAVNENEFRQGKESLIPKNVAMVYLESPNKYTILSSADKTFCPVITKVDRPECHKFVSMVCDCVDDVLNEVDQNGEKFLRVSGPADDVVLAETDHFPVEEANEYDHYCVKTRSGHDEEGMVVPKVINFDQVPQNLKLFLGKNTSTMQENIYGVRVHRSRFEPESCMPHVGQTGTFLFRPDKSHGLATTPVTIKSVVDDCGSLVLKVADLMGAPLKLKMCPSMKHLQRIAKIAPGEYVLPGKMEWVPMKNFGVISDSKESFLSKEAGSRFSAHTATIINKGNDDWAVRGLDKYANEAGFDKGHMRGPEVRFMLSALGCSQEKIAQLTKVAKASGHAKVANLKLLPLWSEKVAEKIPAATEMVEFARSLKANLIKEASYMDNSQTVDALLALNFITPENISKFVSKIPLLKGAISALASCVIASRLGMKEIPEEATSTSMSRLIEVVSGLEKLRATQEVD